MPRATDHRFPAAFADPGDEAPRALHVVNDLGTGFGLQNIIRKEHHLAIGENDFARFRHHTQAVGVAVKSKAHFHIRRLDATDEILKVRGLTRIGMMIGESAVHIKKEFRHLNAQRFKDAAHDVTRHSVAAVKRDLHRTSELNVLRDRLDIGFRHVVLFNRGGRRHGLAGTGNDGVAHGRNAVAEQRHAAHHHLETVVFGGIVRPRHRHTGAVFKVIRCEIKNRRRHHADVDHEGTGGSHALHECRGEFRPRRAAVPSHTETLNALFAGPGSEHEADFVNHFRREGLTHDTADVVSLEYALFGHHQSIPSTKKRHQKGPTGKPAQNFRMLAQFCF